MATHHSSVTFCLLVSIRNQNGNTINEVEALITADFAANDHSEEYFCDLTTADFYLPCLDVGQNFFDDAGPLDAPIRAAIAQMPQQIVQSAAYQAHIDGGPGFAHKIFNPLWHAPAAQAAE